VVFREKQCEFSTCNGPPRSYFLFLTKMGSSEVPRPLKTYHNTKLHGSTLNGSSFEPQKVEHSPLWIG
jgi:hypothetical protein